MSTADDTVAPDFWRVHPEYPGLRVSRDGRVEIGYRVKGCGPGSGKGSRKRVVTDNWRPYKVYTLPSGYRYVQLGYRDAAGKYRRHILYIHRMVAECFIGPRPEGMEVCHDNGFRGDNRVENLKYGTRADNMADCERHGTKPRGSRHGVAKLTEAKVLRVHEDLASGLPMAVIAGKHGVCPATVEHIRHGRTWRHVTPCPSAGKPAQQQP